MSDLAGDQQSEPNHPQKPEPDPTQMEAEWQAFEQEILPTDASQSPPPLADQPRPRPRSVDPDSPLIVVETAFLASAASLIWLVNYYFPIGPVLRVFFPIPIALIYLRWGHRSAWMGALVSGLLLSVLMGPIRSLLFVMPFGVMGVLLGCLWRRRASWGIAILLGGLLGAIGFFFRVWLVSLMLGDDLWLYATTQVTELVEWISVKLGLVFQPSLVLVQGLAIVMVIISYLVYLFVVHLVAWLLLDRLGNPISRPPKWVQIMMEYED